MGRINLLFISVKLYIAIVSLIQGACARDNSVQLLHAVLKIIFFPVHRKEATRLIKLHPLHLIAWLQPNALDSTGERLLHHMRQQYPLGALTRDQIAGIDYARIYAEVVVPLRDKRERRALPMAKGGGLSSTCFQAMDESISMLLYMHDFIS